MAHAPAPLHEWLEPKVILGKWAGVLANLDGNELAQMNEQQLNDYNRLIDNPPLLLTEEGEALAKKLCEGLFSNSVILTPRPRPSTPTELGARLKADRQEILALEDALSAARNQLAKANAEIARQQQDILALSRQLADMRQQLERQNPQPTT